MTVDTFKERKTSYKLNLEIVTTELGTAPVASEITGISINVVCGPESTKVVSLGDPISSEKADNSSVTYKIGGQFTSTNELCPIAGIELVQTGDTLVFEKGLNNSFVVTLKQSNSSEDSFDFRVIATAEGGAKGEFKSNIGLQQNDEASELQIVFIVIMAVIFCFCGCIVLYQYLRIRNHYTALPEDINGKENKNRLIHVVDINIEAETPKIDLDEEQDPKGPPVETAESDSNLLKPMIPRLEDDDKPDESCLSIKQD